MNIADGDELTPKEISIDDFGNCVKISVPCLKASKEYRNMDGRTKFNTARSICAGIFPDAGRDEDSSSDGGSSDGGSSDEAGSDGGARWAELLKNLKYKDEMKSTQAYSKIPPAYKKSKLKKAQLLARLKGMFKADDEDDFKPNPYNSDEDCMATPLYRIRISSKFKEELSAQDKKKSKQHICDKLQE